MNKRIMSIVLVLVMLIGLVAAVVPVAAAGSTSFAMTADKTEAKPGDTITYTVSIGAVEDIVGFKLKLAIPAGLTYVEGSGAAVEGLEDTMDAVKAEFTESSKVFIFGANSRTSYTSASETVLMTFQCTVDADATGDLEINFIIDEDEVYDSDLDNISFTTTTAPVAVAAAGGHEHTWEDATCMAPKTCTECGETEGDVAPHALTHYDAVEAGCHNMGNQEYWQCSVCGGCWLDEACTMFTNVKMVIIPSTGGENVVHFDAVEPGCHSNGNVEYWYCPDCEGFWTDEFCTQVTNSKSVILPATGAELVHFEAVEPACHYNGNVEYWYCAQCDGFWTDEVCTQVTNSKSVILPATGGTVTHFEAIAPACHYNGNIEYWYCSECEQFWADEALTQITNSKSVILPATGSENLQHVEAVAATCWAPGNIEYWFCPDCEQFWADEALTQITNSKSVILPAAAHANLVHYEAVEPACHYNGNVEYWFCPTCEGFWTDEALTQVTNSKSVILPALGGEVVHFEAIAPACHYNGQIEHWYCAECEQFWADEALTQITNSKNIIVPAVGGEVIHVEAVAPTCQSVGNIEYWYCEECEQFWADEALTQITNSKNVILGAGEHTNLVHFEAVEPACHYNGNVEYWFCPDCEGFWTDEALTQVTNSKSVILPATGGEVVHFEAIAPACHYNGQIEHWYCAECEQFWADEALTQITNSKSVILPAIGGEVIYVEAVAPTCQSEGNVEYWFCEECEQFWADEALTQITNSKNVVLGATEHANLVHFEAVEPACHYNGNIEYWFCPDCEGFWTDEALTQVTNSKSVILPATGGEVVHFDAIAPKCHYNGNIEYWFCAECEQFWADEALTQITNSKSVILPATGGEVVHFDAIAPACHYNGNIEYWFCPDCEGFWADEALTQVTNSKNVVLPALGSDKLQHVAYKAPTATEDGNVEYWYCPDCEGFWLDEALTQITNSKSVILPATGEQVPETGDASIFGYVVILMVATCGAALVIGKKKFAR